mmetsp:Transcript_3374/g.4960  ORF Transcript_3374/g.4960 Transcript_3374/m.4960 type:complete len:168 (-) Transcript_3374:86-589(-)
MVSKFLLLFFMPPVPFFAGWLSLQPKRVPIIHLHKFHQPLELKGGMQVWPPRCVEYKRYQGGKYRANNSCKIVGHNPSSHGKRSGERECHGRDKKYQRRLDESPMAHNPRAQLLLRKEGHEASDAQHRSNTASEKHRTDKPQDKVCAEHALAPRGVSALTRRGTQQG